MLSNAASQAKIGHKHTSVTFRKFWKKFSNIDIFETFLKNFHFFSKMSIFEIFFQNLRRATEARFCPILACDTALESFKVVF